MSAMADYDQCSWPVWIGAEGRQPYQTFCIAEVDALTLDQTQEITSFFERMGGNQPFYFQP